MKLSREEFISKTLDGNYAVCLICGERVYSSQHHRHFKNHGLTVEEYYRKYVDDSDKCICGKTKRFHRLGIGFWGSCGDEECVRSLKTQATVNSWSTNSERRERASESAKKQWEDPHHREFMSRVFSSHATRQWEDPEFRSKMIESSRLRIIELWKDPGFSSKVLENLSKGRDLWGSESHREMMRKVSSETKLRNWEDLEWVRYTSAFSIYALFLKKWENEERAYVYIGHLEDYFKFGIAIRPESRTSHLLDVRYRELSPEDACRLELIMKIKSPLIGELRGTHECWTEWRSKDIMDEYLSLLSLSVPDIRSMSGKILGEIR